MRGGEGEMVGGRKVERKEGENVTKHKWGLAACAETQVYSKDKGRWGKEKCPY